MLKVLRAHEKDGINVEDFVRQIQSMVEVSRGKVFTTVKDFLFHGLMREETDSKDRRRKRYYPNMAKVKAQATRFRIEDFIQSLKDVQSFEYEKAVGDYDLTVSLLFEHYRKVELAPEMKQVLLNGVMVMLEPFMKDTKVDAFALFVGCRKHGKKV